MFAQRDPRVHGPRGAEQRHGVRQFGGLVLLRVHALQAAQGPLPLQATQDTGQARDRQDDPNNGKKKFNLFCCYFHGKQW